MKVCGDEAACVVLSAYGDSSSPYFSYVVPFGCPGEWRPVSGVAYKDMIVSDKCHVLILDDDIVGSLFIVATCCPFVSLGITR